MSSLGTSVQRATRASSRGINYYNNNMKSSLPNYGYSSKKDPKFYETKLLKSQTPAYSSALRNSMRNRNNNYNYDLNEKDRDKKSIQNDIDNMKR